MHFDGVCSGPAFGIRHDLKSSKTAFVAFTRAPERSRFRASFARFVEKRLATALKPPTLAMQDPSYVRDQTQKRQKVTSSVTPSGLPKPASVSRYQASGAGSAVPES